MLDLEGERKVDRPLWIFYRKISAANFALSRNSWKIGSLIFPRSEVLSRSSEVSSSAGSSMKSGCRWALVPRPRETADG